MKRGRHFFLFTPHSFQGFGIEVDFIFWQFEMLDGIVFFDDGNRIGEMCCFSWTMNRDVQFLCPWRVLHIDAHDCGHTGIRYRKEGNFAFEEGAAHLGLWIIDRDFDPQNFTLFAAECLSCILRMAFSTPGKLKREKTDDEEEETTQQ